MDINGGFSSTPCLFTGGDCRRDSGFGPQNEAIFIGERRNKPPLSWEQTCILWPNNEVLTCSISFQFYCIYIYIIIVCYEIVMIYSYMSFYNICLNDFMSTLRFSHGSRIVGWFHAFGVLFVCCPMMWDRCFVGGVPDFSSLRLRFLRRVRHPHIVAFQGPGLPEVAGAKEVKVRFQG
jgi:hypothetical protein